MRTVTDMTATDLAPSTSCSVVVFGDKPRSGIWRVWLLLILPPVLLMTLSFGYAVVVAWVAADAPTLRLASSSAPLGSNQMLALVSGIVLGGFVEEQLYRGYVLVRLTERRSLVMAMASMLVFFGLLHFGLGWTGMLVATMTGFTLTLLFIWRRSLVSVVIAHALINTLVLTF